MEALFCSVDLHFWETCLRPAGEIKPKLINISNISRHAPLILNDHLMVKKQEEEEEE